MVKVCETMGMKKFAYLFTLGGRIVWSSENENSLMTRMATEPKAVHEDVREFVDTSTPGMHMQLPTGEFIFRTA